MLSNKQLTPNAVGLFDEEALVKEARLISRRSRRRRGMILVAIVAAASLIAVGLGGFSSSTAPPGPRDTSMMTCPSARVKLLSATSIPGAAVTAGVLVRASVSSRVSCTMSGYPTVEARLSSLSDATARDERTGIFGGLPYSSSASREPPRIIIASHTRLVSFTVDFLSGDGSTCPRIESILVSLPGLRLSSTVRTMRQGGRVGGQQLGIYCGFLDVTPLVKGSSGKG